MKVPFDINAYRNVGKILLFAVSVWFCIWVIRQIFITFLIISSSVLLAYLVYPAIAWLSARSFPGTRKKISRNVSALIAHLVLVLLLIGFSAILIPLALEQAGSIVSSIPDYLRKGDQMIGEIKQFYQQLHLSPALQDAVGKYAEQISATSGPMLSQVAQHLGRGIRLLFDVVLVAFTSLIVSYYIVLDGENIKGHFLDMFPETWHKDIEELMQNMAGLVGAFVRGQILLCAIVGVGTYVGLMLLRLLGIKFEFALLTSIFSAILFVVPYFGVWIPRIAATVVAYFQPGGWEAAIGVFSVIALVEMLVIKLALPVVMGKQMRIPPLLILLVILAGGELFGFWGLVLSVPAAAMIRLVFVYVERIFSFA